MLKNIYSLINLKHRARPLIVILMMLSLFLCTNLSASVNFIQSSTGDFNNGFHDNVLIADGNISLPSKADGVDQWNTTTVLPQNLTGHRTATWKNLV